MKKEMHWGIVLLIESAALLIAAVLMALTEWLPSAISYTALWGAYPLLGAVAAYIATRRGVNNYLAWIPAPVMFPAGYYLIWGYLASPAPMFISALLGIVGAAAGETKNQFERRQQK